MTTSNPLTFESIYYQHERKVRGTLFRLGLRPPQLDDLVQDVFLKIWKNKNSLDQVQKISSWIYQVTRNTAFDYFRSKQSMKMASLDEVKDTLPSHEKSLSDQEIVQQSLETLSFDMREVVVLFYFEDQGTEDIASILQVPEGTVKSRLARAREKLEFEIKKRGGEHV